MDNYRRNDNEMGKEQCTHSESEEYVHSENEEQSRQGVKISRRKLLASMGMAGAAVASGAMIPGIGGQALANPNREVDNNYYRYADELPERTVGNRLRDYISVKDFGAVGDGDTDDTDAIQEAINFVLDNGQRELYFPAGTYHDRGELSDASAVHFIGDNVQFTSGKYETLSVGKNFDRAEAHMTEMEQQFIDRGINIKDFGAQGDGVTDDSKAINAASLYAKENNLAVVFPSGVYRCTQTLQFYEGVQYTGVNSGTNWRPAPNSLSGTFQPELYENARGTVLLFTGVGDKDYVIDHVSSSTQNGYDRTNSLRPFTNENDATFELKDFTNQDASGTSKASLKPFSVAVEVVGDSEQRVIINNIRIITSCPGHEETHGTAGYGVSNEVLPYAQWDVGLFMQSPWRCELNTVEVVGYWGVVGLLIYPQREGEANRGYAEHNIFRNCVVQSGTAIRSGDTWAVLSKTNNSFTIRWTASHRFDTSGSVRVGRSFANNSIYEYTNLVYNGEEGTLTFEGVQDTSGIEVEGDFRHHVITTVGGGFAHTIFYDCELYDFSHTTLLDDADPLLGRKYSASIEMSGNPMRAIKFYNTVFSPLGRVCIHAGKAWDIEFYSCYIEPRRGRSTLGGSLESRGSVIIWGPTEEMESEVGMNSGNGGSLRMYGRTLHPSVNAAPTLFVNSGYRYSSLGDADFFRPLNFFYDQEQFRLDRRITRLWGNRNYEIDIRLRQEDSTLVNVLKGFPASGSTGIGDNGDGVSRILVDTSGPIQIRDSVRSNVDGEHDLGTSTYRWDNVYSANDAIQTSDERDKQNIEDIPEVWLDAWAEVKWKRYKLKSSVAQKGEQARWHTGLVAQQVKNAFEKRGIDPFEIGLLCYDEWEDQRDCVQVPVLDGEGNVIDHKEEVRIVKSAGSRYAIRYNEAQVMEAAYQRREIEKLKKIIASK